MNAYLAPGAEISKIPTSSDKFTMLSATKVTNVKITGRGRLNGSGRLVRKKTNYGWMHMLLVYECKDIVIEDITLFNSPSANIWVEYADNIQVYNTKLLAEPGFSNTDGIDMTSSTNSKVDNVFMCITDDASNLATDTTHPQKDTENIEYTNLFYCNSEGTGAPIALSGGIRKGGNVKNCYFENYDVVWSESANRYTPRYGGDIENIWMNNVRCEGLKYQGLIISMQSSYSWDPDFKGVLGNIKNLYFDYLILPGGMLRQNRLSGCMLDGEAHTISNVEFNNVYLDGALVTDIKSGNFQTNEYTSNINFTSKPTNLVNTTTEGNSSVVFTRTVVNDKPLIINYKVRGNANNGIDYKMLSGQITIPANEASARLVITVIKKSSSNLQAIILLKRGEGYVIGSRYISTVNL